MRRLLGKHYDITTAPDGHSAVAPRWLPTRSGADGRHDAGLDGFGAGRGELSWHETDSQALAHAAVRRAPPRIKVSGRIENGEAIYRVEDNGAGFDMRPAEPGHPAQCQ